jgi:hypothetical protein
MRSKRKLLALLVFAFGASACATYHDELQRGQQDYERNEHEHALAVFRALETDQSHFDVTDEAHYAYLRGMTDYRIGYRADARHWLVIAQAIEDANKESLPTEWKARMKTTLAELNSEVYGGGMAALANDGKKSKSDEPLKAVKKSEDEP